MSGINKFTVLFHSINGANIKEKYRNFNKFLDLLKASLLEQDLNNFIKSIIPKTTLEESFIIEIIIQSKNKQLLLDELKACNVIFVKKLLRNWQLFEELFLNITATDLVDNILPHLSYSLKLKILNGVRKNVKNEELLDEYFNALEKRYGLKIATFVLPGCSINLIRSKVEKFHMKLLQPYLTDIFKKDKQFVEFYFDVLRKKYETINFTYNYLNTLKHIARVDPHIYWKLHDKYNLKVKFGKYMTPTMVKTHQNISKEGSAALDIFHYLKLFKTTKKEGTFNSFLVSLFPEAHDQFKDQFLTYNILKFIRKVPPSQQYRLVSLSFTEKYKKSLQDYPNYFTEELLEITPIQEREPILDIKVKQNEDLNYLYGTSVSIPRLIKQLQHSSDSNTRIEIGRLLYKTCVSNKDEVGLLDVLRYVSSRYKNDKNFLSKFFENLMDWPNIGNLSEEHWRYMAIMYAIIGNKPWNAKKFAESYTYYLIKNKKSIHDFANQVYMNSDRSEMLSFINLSDPHYQKEYFDELAKWLDSYKDHDKYRALCREFLGFTQWVWFRKRIEILDYARFFDQLDDNDPIRFKACSKSELIHEDGIHERFWKSNNFATNRFILWYAKHRPDLLRKHIQKLPRFADMCHIGTFLRKFKKFCDPDVLRELKDQALHFVQNENYSEATFSVHAISVLAPDYFSELITPLLPATDGKIALEDTSTEKVTLQKEIAKALSNIAADHLKSFPLILKFCVGDYLMFGLQPLYKGAYNIPEIQTKSYLNELSKTAISVKKHVLLLGKDVFVKDDFYELLRDWSQKETNLSLRNIILKKSIERFIESPSERIWLLLNTNLNSIDVDDRVMYDFLLKYEEIPQDYQSKYLKIVYQALSQNSDPKINEKKIYLINTISSGIITKFDEEFLKHIIRETAFSKHSTNFYWKCVFHANEGIQLVLFEENLAKLKQYVEINSPNIKDDAQIKNEVSCFLRCFINLSIELKQGLHLIQKFISVWDTVFHNDLFDKEYMLMTFAEIYLKSGFNAYQFGLKINRLLYQYITKCNNSVIDFYCAEVCNFLADTSIAHNEDEKFKFVEGIFHDKKDENVYIAIIYFLPEILPTFDNRYASYIPIIRSIEGCNSPVVQYYFDEYLRSNSLFNINSSIKIDNV